MPGATNDWCVNVGNGMLNEVVFIDIKKDSHTVVLFGMVIGKTLSTKIQKLQNRAVGVITRSSYDTNASDLLNAWHLGTIWIRRKKQKAHLMFKY